LTASALWDDGGTTPTEPVRLSETTPQSASPLAPDVESHPGLLRALGPGMAIAVVVGNVIGSGIYAKPGLIAAKAGDFRLILAAWVTGGILCILGALCFAELAVMLPRAGGLYVYLREAYGRTVAFLFGWSEFVFGRPASIGALSMIFVGSLGQATGWKMSITSTILIAFLLIAGLAWINVMGVIWGGRMQGATTALKAGLLALVAALPFVMPLFGEQGIDAANYRSTLTVDEAMSPERPNGVESKTNGKQLRSPETAVRAAHRSLAGQFAIVLLAVMWAYNGWHGITPIAEEVRNPQRNIPLALFGGIGLLIVLYVSANVAYHGVLSIDEMAKEENQEHVAEIMVGRLIGPFWQRMMSASVMLSVLGAINSNLLLGPRVSFAMGRDDVFFRSLGRIHVNYRTPAAAIIVQATMGMVLIIASALLVSFVKAFAGKNIFGLLTAYVVFSASIFYMLAVFAVIVLRKRRPEWHRPYRTLGYPLVPLLYLTFYSCFLYYVFVGQPMEAIIGIGLISLGLPVYFGYRAWARHNPQLLHDGQ
jgi:amino acid transporter